MLRGGSVRQCKRAFGACKRTSVKLLPHEEHWATWIGQRARPGLRKRLEDVWECTLRLTMLQIACSGLKRSCWTCLRSNDLHCFAYVHDPLFFT